MVEQIQGLNKLLSSKAEVTAPTRDTRTLEELTALLPAIRQKLAGGADPTKDELRIIVSYFRLYRKNASEESRAAKAKKTARKRVQPKLTAAEEQAILDSL